MCVLYCGIRLRFTSHVSVSVLKSPKWTQGFYKAVLASTGHAQVARVAFGSVDPEVHLAKERNLFKAYKLCGKFKVHRVSNTNMNPVGRGSWTASSSQNGSSFNVQSHAETSTSQPCAHASGAATSETPCPASAWTYGTIAPILNYKIVKLCAQAWTKTAESTCTNSNKQTHEFRKEALEVPHKIFICHCMLESWGIASARLVSTCALIYYSKSNWNLI